MKGRLFLVALFVLALSTGTSFTQSTRAPDDDSCFPHKTLYTTVSIEFTDDNSRFSTEIGRTVRNKVYKVVRSERDWLFGSSCWIQTTRGWLLRRPSGSVIRPGEPKTTSTTRTTTTSSKCYSASKAYITGTMNMRAGASTNSKITKKAHAGDSFAIKNSVRKGDYCWIQTSGGLWMAKTGRVQSTKPVVRTTTNRTTATTTSTCAAPPIHGSAELKKVVRNAYNALGSWCGYVQSANPSSIGETYIGCGQMDGDRRQIKIGIRWSLFCQQDDAVRVASALVHEACHLHQYNSGVRFWYDNIHIHEPPCYRKQIEFLRSVAPGQYNRYIRRLQEIVDTGDFGY